MNIIHNALIETGVIEKEDKPAFPTWAKGKKVEVKAPWYTKQAITEATVVEVFRIHKGEWILNCADEGRKNQVTLYGEEQYRLFELYDSKK